MVVAFVLGELECGLDPGAGVHEFGCGSSEHRQECLCHLGVIRFVCWFDILLA